MGRFESIGAIQPFLKLQEGEWADVYKAYDTALGRNVLLKRLKSEYAGDETIAQRFEEEARLMAQVKHPNVVSVLSSVRSEKAVYFIAEFIEGQAADALLQNRGLPVQLTAHILREIASGLKAAHDHSIFHRDIKPSNILISAVGEVKLTDFGMASLMETSDNAELRGTLGYIAPELVLEGEPSIASDLFSLGATLFEMLTGQAAFLGATPSEIFDQVLNHDPLPILAANPTVHPDVLKICRTLLQKEPHHRYADCWHLIEDIRLFLDRVPTFDGSKALLSFLVDPGGYEEVPISSTAELNQNIGHTSTIEDLEVSLMRLPIYRRPEIQRAGIFLFIVAGLMLLFNLSNNGDAAIKSAVNPAVESVTSNPSESTGEDITPPIPAAAQAFLDTLQLEQNVLSPPLNVTPNEVPEPAATNGITTTDSISSGTALAESNSVREDVSQTSTIVEVPGELNILCTPYCNVLIDNILIGTAPPMLSVLLTPGNHEIALVHPQLPAYAGDIFIESGQLDSIKVALRDLVGTIELKIIPSAEVYIDSVHYGKIPPTKSFTLQPGEHTLTLEHAKLGTLSTKIIVAAGEHQSYSFNMKKPLEN